MPNSAYTLSHACPVCHECNGRLHQALEMMLGTRESFPYWECDGCGCVSLAEPPESFSKYYPPNAYYSMQGRPARFIRKLRDRIYLSPASPLVNWQPRTDLDVIRHVGLTKSMSLLDVGCGAGRLLGDLRELGYNATGIDPFVPDDVVDRFGVRVRRKTLAEVDSQYDVVLFRHSLEHMPLEALGGARKLLGPNGICIICIPVIGWAWRHYGINWVQLDAPRHLFLHTRNSFEILANQSGFRVEHVIYDSNEFQFWGSEAYRRDLPLCQATAPGRREAMRLRRRAAELNRQGEGDAAQFYLRPIG